MENDGSTATASNESQVEASSSTEGSTHERTFTRAELAKIVTDERKRAKAEGKSEAEKLMNLTDPQKLAYQHAQLEAEAEELKQELNRSSVEKQATALLSKLNIEASDEVLGFVLKGNVDDTNDAINTFSRLVDVATAKKVRSALTGKAPRVNTGGGHTMTKDEIMKIKDPIKRQEAIRQNISLYR